MSEINSTQSRPVPSMTPQSRALAEKMRAQRQAELAAIPTGHVVALATTRLHGPQGKQDPRGHPIHIDTGLFDNSVETAVEAIARIAHKREGIGINLDHWKLTMYEDVLQPPPHKQPVPFTRFYHFEYLPEVPLLKQRGHHDGKHSKVPNHFKSSWYLTRNHHHGEPHQALARTLAPIHQEGQ